MNAAAWYLENLITPVATWTALIIVTLGLLFVLGYLALMVVGFSMWLWEQFFEEEEEK